MHHKGIVHGHIGPDTVYVENAHESLEFLVKLDGLEDVFVLYDSRTSSDPAADHSLPRPVIRSGPLRSSFFNAPETYDSAFNEKVDVWSVGLLMYHFIVGEFPFDEEDFFDESRNGKARILR